MKKTILALSLAALSVPALAQGKKPEPEYTITGNVGVFSDYRFRGISQTRLAPALQGGFDLAHKSGFYLGNWNSNVSGDQYYYGTIEMDLYGGYKTEVMGVGVDLGTIYYYYPSAKNNQTNGDKFDNHEVYVGLSYGPVSFKTSYALTDYFGVNNKYNGGTNRGESKGTLYLDLTLSQEISKGLTLVAHVGQTQYKNYTELDYLDYRLGVNYAFADGWTLGLSYYSNTFDTATGKTFVTSTANVTGGTIPTKQLYKNAAVFSISKTF